MNKLRIFQSLCVLALILALQGTPGMAQDIAPLAAPLGTAFTYQGRLEKDGAPLNGTCDLVFRLWDALSSGVQIGATQTRTNVALAQGAFTVQLDFGSGAFQGDARWLAIEVRCPAGAGTYTPLAPRQPLTAAPNALNALNTAPHSHLGQTWLGSDNPLVISGSFGTPDRAPLVLSNAHVDGDGVRIESAGNTGVYVNAAGGNGMAIGSAGYDGVHVYAASNAGVYVNAATDDGFNVYQAGNPSAMTSSDRHNGFEVAGAEGHGLYVGRADDCGVFVKSSGAYGVYVGTAANDGFVIVTAGNPSVASLSYYHNGLEVMGAEGSGLYVGRADRSGAEVNSAGLHGLLVGKADGDGVHIVRAGNPSAISISAAANGFEVEGAEGYGLRIGRSDAAGVLINSAGGSGVYVNSASADGLHVDAATDDGVYISSAGDIGAYANTTLASHEWGFYTPDMIYAGSALAAGGPSLLVAQASEALQPGDPVAVAGIGAPFGESDFPTPLVRRAAPGVALVGVVHARFVAEEKVDEVDHEGGLKTAISLRSRSAEGPANRGDYLLIVVFGPARVRASGPIAPGELLAVGTDGQATRLGTTSTPGSVLGAAMEAIAQGSGLIWVLVNPR